MFLPSNKVSYGIVEMGRFTFLNSFKICSRRTTVYVQAPPPWNVPSCSTPCHRLGRLTFVISNNTCLRRMLIKHVTIHNPPFDSPTLSSSQKKRGPPKMDNFTCKQLGQNEGHVQNVSSHNSEQLSLLEFRSFDKPS
ncbi:hypothetical protein HZ326_23879 [Fusarium oxysporum f. sp. albedinis]|nr:Uncharacterized protein HZ326_29223 [Fusarium oxysporum f. sp. albedinis]KAJ0133050.1 hypothetical protein HZ326_23879 [Fusarium oxysporum f. sp. albedinis]